MSKFNEYLWLIAKRITIRDEDRQIYTRDFEIIRDHVVKSMCSVDSVFKKLFTGYSLFGSYSNNVRINRPKEFDVIIQLSAPYSYNIKVIPDESRPGFVFLDFEEAMEAMEDSDNYETVYDKLNELVDYDNDLMRNSSLQGWIKNVIKDALYYYGKKVTGWNGDIYRLKYTKRALAHTIYAKCAARSISIDLVPGFALNNVEWAETYDGPFMYKCRKWFAVPRRTDGPKETRNFTFMFCNPKAEHDVLLGKQNLKVIFRLLKSLRDSYEMDRMKSYFITTAFLWEVNDQEEDFWNQSIGYLLVHMLDILYDYFDNQYLPFFWDTDLNLLDILSEEEIEEYKESLGRAFNTLSTYEHQPKLSYQRCETHFEIGE